MFIVTLGGIMTLQELEALLATVQPGQGAQVPYAVYDELFPPGEPDETARAAAFRFARANGCSIDNRPQDQSVWFLKDAAQR
jgi:hypothetical protein